MTFLGMNNRCRLRVVFPLFILWKWNNELRRRVPHRVRFTLFNWGTAACLLWPQFFWRLFYLLLPWRADRALCAVWNVSPCALPRLVYFGPLSFYRCPILTYVYVCVCIVMYRWPIVVFCLCDVQLQSATKIRRSRFRRAYTDAASETLTPHHGAAVAVASTSAAVPPVSITVRLGSLSLPKSVAFFALLSLSAGQRNILFACFPFSFSTKFKAQHEAFWFLFSFIFFFFMGRTFDLYDPVGWSFMCIKILCTLLNVLVVVQKEYLLGPANKSRRVLRASAAVFHKTLSSSSSSCHQRGRLNSGGKEEWRKLCTLRSLSLPILRSYIRE